jgi:heme A synthase
MIRILAQTGFPAEIGNVIFPTNRSSWATATSDPASIAIVFLNWLLPFAGILAAAAVVYSGVMYITASGNSEKTEKAKKNLTWSIIGVILVVLSAAIITWINTILNNAHP